MHRALLDALPVPVVATDGRGRVRFQNARAAALLAAEPDAAPELLERVRGNVLHFGVAVARARGGARGEAVVLVDPATGGERRYALAGSAVEEGAFEGTVWVLLEGAP